MSSQFSLEEQLEAAKAMRAAFSSGGKSARSGMRSGGGSRSTPAYGTPNGRSGQAPASGSASRPSMMGPYTVGPSTAAPKFKPVSPSRGRGNSGGGGINAPRNLSPGRLTRPSVLQIKDTVDNLKNGPRAGYRLAGESPRSILEKQSIPAVGNHVANWQAFAASGPAPVNQQSFGMPGPALTQQAVLKAPAAVPAVQIGLMTSGPAPNTQRSFSLQGQPPNQQQGVMVSDPHPATQRLGTMYSQAPAQQQAFIAPCSRPQNQQALMTSGFAIMSQPIPAATRNGGINQMNFPVPASSNVQATVKSLIDQVSAAGSAVISKPPLTPSESPPRPIRTNMDPKEFIKPFCPAHLQQPSSKVAIQQIADALHVRYEDLTSDGVTIPATNPKAPRRVLGALGAPSFRSLDQIAQVPVNLAASNWAPGNAQQQSQVGGGFSVNSNTAAQKAFLNAGASPWATAPVNNTTQALSNAFEGASVGTASQVQHSRVQSGSAMDLDVPENSTLVGMPAFNPPGMSRSAIQTVNTGPGFPINRDGQGSASYAEARAFAHNFFTAPPAAPAAFVAQENMRHAGNLPHGNNGAQLCQTINANPYTQGIQVADNGFGVANPFQATHSVAPIAQAPSFRSINVTTNPPTTNSNGFFAQTVGVTNCAASSRDLKSKPPAKKVQTLKDSMWAH